MFYQCNFWYRAFSEQFRGSYGAIVIFFISAISSVEQFQSNSRAVTEQFWGSFRSKSRYKQFQMIDLKKKKKICSTPVQHQNISRAFLVQIESSFRAAPALSNLNTVSKQFHYNFKRFKVIFGAIFTRHGLLNQQFLFNQCQNYSIVRFQGKMFGLDARVGAYCTQRLSRISPVLTSK